MNKCRTTIITNFSGPGTSCSSGTGCSRCRNSINSQLYFAVISISSISGCVTTIAAVTTVTAYSCCTDTVKCSTDGAIDGLYSPGYSCASGSCGITIAYVSALTTAAALAAFTANS